MARGRSRRESRRGCRSCAATCPGPKIASDARRGSTAATRSATSWTPPDAPCTDRKTKLPHGARRQPLRSRRRVPTAAAEPCSRRRRNHVAAADTRGDGQRRDEQRLPSQRQRAAEAAASQAMMAAQPCKRGGGLASGLVRTILSVESLVARKELQTRCERHATATCCGAALTHRCTPTANARLLSLVSLNLGSLVVTASGEGGRLPLEHHMATLDLLGCVARRGAVARGRAVGRSAAGRRELAGLVAKRDWRAEGLVPERPRRHR
jgi:hypothetical protein